MSQKERDINIITLGETGVGKTSILNRLKNDSFHDNELSTPLINIFIQQKKYEKRKLTINLKFRDTGGQEKFLTSLPKQYMRDSHVVLLVFSDIKNLTVLKDRWYKHYKENTNIDNAKFILVGNKSDLFDKNREEIIKQGNQFSEEIDAHFITCSAKSKDNMDNLERYILTEAKRFIDEEIKLGNRNLDENATFRVKKTNNKKKCCD